MPLLISFFITSTLFSAIDTNNSFFCFLFFPIFFLEKKQVKLKERYKVEFIFEKAVQKDREEIWTVMKEAAQTTKKKEWFAAGDEAYIQEILEGEGFIILAREAKSRELAGFFIVVIPGEKNYMGIYADVPKKDTDKIVHNGIRGRSKKASFRGK